MTHELKIEYSILDRISPIWRNSVGLIYKSDLSDTDDCLKKMVDFANQLNFESRAHSRKTILDRVTKRGLRFDSRSYSRGSDTTELLGLIGEIIVEDFISRIGYSMFYTKWRIKGTSKSRGIDMIASDAEEPKKIFLIEAKHIHNITDNLSYTIRKRFKDGIKGFDKEKTIFNLAGILGEFSDAISKHRQFMSSTQELEDKCIFLEQLMITGSYGIIIVVCIDKTKYNGVNFRKLMREISSETNVGLICYSSFNILKINLLDEKTKLIVGIEND